MIPKPDYVCKTVKVIPEGAKQTRNYSELVFNMDNIYRSDSGCHNFYVCDTH